MLLLDGSFQHHTTLYPLFIWNFAVKGCFSSYRKAAGRWHESSVYGHSKVWSWFCCTGFIISALGSVFGAEELWSTVSGLPLSIYRVPFLLCCQLHAATASLYITGVGKSRHGWVFMPLCCIVQQAGGLKELTSQIITQKKLGRWVWCGPISFWSHFLE